MQAGPVDVWMWRAAGCSTWVCRIHSVLFSVRALPSASQSCAHVHQPQWNVRLESQNQTVCFLRGSGSGSSTAAFDWLTTPLLRLCREDKVNAVTARAARRAVVAVAALEA